ncbi:MAG: TetR/AcrR family transcriptional regulator [Fusicatenibacter sp.]|nr:TetR/AcrR family transcriptional regulator [Fusicatenibacter sp.]
MKKEEKTELTKARILEAAMEVFGKDGYGKGTLNQICSRGINKGLIYHNFKNKDELYLICVKISCDALVEYVKKQEVRGDMKKYMEARQTFFTANEQEAHLFFEVLLDPPDHLRDPIHEILKEFDKMNREIYQKTISDLRLRDGVSAEDAFSYFAQMQLMFNGYFSSPAFRKMDLSEKIRMHETSIPKLLDFMLYGIAERRK